MGKKNNSNVSINDYWQNYSKENKKTKDRLKSFSKVLTKCTSTINENLNTNFEELVDSIIYLLSKNDIKYNNNFFNKENLFDKLRLANKENIFRSFIHKILLLKTFPSQEIFNNLRNELIELLKNCHFTNNNEIKTSDIYFKYEEYVNQEDPTNSSFINVKVCNNGLKIKFDTIHGIKGETHYATLILETKYSQQFDIPTVLKYISNGKPERNSVNAKKFMKQLYVASSRPKYMLAMVAKLDRIQEYIPFLESIGWEIEII